MLIFLQIFIFITYYNDHAATSATVNQWHEEEVARRAWWDRSLLSGGLETGNSAPAGCWQAAQKMAAEGIFRPVSENRAVFIMFGVD